MPGGLLAPQPGPALAVQPAVSPPPLGTELSGLLFFRPFGRGRTPARSPSAGTCLLHYLLMLSRQLLLMLTLLEKAQSSQFFFRSC